jgi:hypothetical protein
MRVLMDHRRNYGETGEYHERDQSPFCSRTGPALGVAILVSPAIAIAIPQTPTHE